MKIGILTLTLDSNYGGILQAYALQTVLEHMGHEVTVFNRRRPKVKAKWVNILKRFRHKLMGERVIVFSEAKLNREAPIINKWLWDFKKKYIHEYYIESFDDIKKKDIDGIVVGSDQVWRPKFFVEQWNDTVDNAYLSFAKDWNIKRVAYAASYGTEVWEYSDQETEAIKQAIKLFNAVSVREHEGITLIKEHLNASATYVVDPTFLLSVKAYNDIINSSSTPKSPGNLLSYILDATEDKQELLDVVSAKTGLIPFSVNRDELLLTKPIEERIKPSVEAWLRGFIDAEFVVTDSFHACAFSFIFNKPFVVIGNKHRGMARFHSLLLTFGQEFRLVENKQEYLDRYDAIHGCPNVVEIINEERRRAMEYLNNSLNQ